MVNLPRLRTTSAVSAAMLCAASVMAQLVAGKATRDALYLAHLDVTSLPAMLMVSAAFSIVLVAISSRAFRRIHPAAFVPFAFVINAGLLLAEWALVSVVPTIAAQAVYLQLSGVGPILGSGFWLIASERFDPRTAKRRFGQIAAAGTLGGLTGGLLTERVGAALDVTAMLPLLAMLNVFCAWRIRALAVTVKVAAPSGSVEISPELAPEPTASGVHVLAHTPYLKSLAALILLGTVAAALADYVFKVQAVATLGSGDNLLRLFAGYYAATSLITFVVQTSASQFALERFGLGSAVGSPSVVLLVGSVGGLVAPGVESAMAARGGESILRGSLFRAGYELFYTPIPPSEKRAAKSLIDVGVDRLGEAVGGGLIRVVMLMLAPARQSAALNVAAAVCSAAALLVASRLHRGYISTLERSLLNRAVELDLSDVEDTTTRTTMVRTLRSMARLRQPLSPDHAATRSPEPHRIDRGANVLRQLDADMLQILALKSRDRERILRVLDRVERVPAVLVPHIIPLLAWDPVAADAVKALKNVAEERVGELVDALLDPNEDYAVRRRLARVFAVCASQRAADGLLLGLGDQRFEVRFQCARSLRAVLENNPAVRIDRERLLEVVRREVAVGRPMWESHRLLHALDDADAHHFVDEFVKDRASRSLGHVFTLLSLVLPTEPLQIAFRGLHTNDQNLRGTALEYLEGVLPSDIRHLLWPFLEDRRPPNRTARPRDEILADLLRSHESIMINLTELQHRDADRAAAPGPERA